MDSFLLPIKVYNLFDIEVRRVDLFFPPSTHTLQCYSRSRWGKDGREREREKERKENETIDRCARILFQNSVSHLNDFETLAATDVPQLRTFPFFLTTSFLMDRTDEVDRRKSGSRYTTTTTTAIYCNLSYFGCSPSNTQNKTAVTRLVHAKWVASQLFLIRSTFGWQHSIRLGGGILHVSPACGSFETLATLLMKADGKSGKRAIHII